MVRLGIAQEGLLEALGPRASRDIQIGIDLGRFVLKDVSIASAMTFGSMLAVMHDYLDGDRKEDPSSMYAAMLLRMVGISPEEAEEISLRPLPPLPELDSSEMA
jgi:hypothetical protein